MEITMGFRTLIPIILMELNFHTHGNSQSNQNDRSKMYQTNPGVNAHDVFLLYLWLNIILRCHSRFNTTWLFIDDIHLFIDSL